MHPILEMLETLDPGAVLVSALAMIALGSLWYSHLLFGRAWIRLSGIRPGDIRPADARRTLLCRVFTALIAALLLGLMAAHGDHSRAMMLACVVVIWAFIMLEQLNGCIRRREPVALFLLQTTRSLVCLLAGAAVFFWWG